jgi:hypothetical protein
MVKKGVEVLPKVARGLFRARGLLSVKEPIEPLQLRHESRDVLQIRRII